MNQIKFFREKSGLLQEEFAKAIGVNQSAISLWETGETFTNTKNLKKLSTILNCTVDELLQSAKIKQSLSH